MLRKITYKDMRALSAVLLLFCIHTLEAQLPGGVNNIRWGQVHYDFYKFAAGGITSIDQIETANPLRSGYANTFDVEAAFPVADSSSLAYRFTAHLYVPQDGNWQFVTASDDGVRVFLDGVMIINRDTLRGCGATTAQDTVTVPSLTEGWHTMQVDYFNGPGGYCLDLQWRRNAATPPPFDSIPSLATGQDTFDPAVGGLAAPVMNTWLDMSFRSGNDLPDRAEWNPFRMRAGATYVAGAADPLFNYNDYVRLDGNTGDFFRDGMKALSSNEGITSFIVTRRDLSNNTGLEGVLSYAVRGGALEANEFVLYRPSNMGIGIRAFMQGGSPLGENTNTNITGRPNILAVAHNNNTTPSNSLRFFLNGDRVFNSDFQRTIRPRGGGNMVFGREQNAYNGSFTAGSAYPGAYAEVILYNRQLTVPEREQVQSYLGLKYGITLTHDYLTATGDVYWNYGANTAYNNRIFGVGREFRAGTAQGRRGFVKQRSRSVEAGGQIVEIQTDSNLTPDLAYWVCGDNNGLFTNNNLASYEGQQQPAYISYRTPRQWRVGATANFTQDIEFVFDLNGFPAQILNNTAAAYMLVSNNTNFTNVNDTIRGLITGTQFRVTVPGAILQNGRHFTLGFRERDPDVVFFNPGLATGANPLAFEACVGSVVHFSYANASTRPNQVIFKDRNGNDIFVNPLLSSTTSGCCAGVLHIPIPANAVSSVPILWNTGGGGRIIFEYSTPLIINNPEVGFALGQSAPYCATGEAINLQGYPVGGDFRSFINAVQDTTNIVGYDTTNMRWVFNPQATITAGDTNQVLQDVEIRYVYRPNYISNPTIACPQEFLSNQTVRVYDNRLFSVALSPIDTPSPNFPQASVLIEPLIRAVSPTLDSSATPFPYSWSFTGSYVGNPDAANGTFIYGSSGDGSHPITATLNIGGCESSIPTIVDVFFPIGIPGLDFFVCQDAPSIPFYRPITQRDTVTRDTTFASSILGINTTLYGYSGGITRRDRIQYGERISGPDIIPNRPGAITTINSTPNNEVYLFDPSALDPSDTLIEIRIRYRRTTEVWSYPPWFFFFLSSWFSPPSPNYNRFTDDFTASQFIRVLPRPTVEIDTLIVGNFCSNEQPLPLLSSPTFDNPTRTVYWLENISTNAIDSLERDTVLNFADVYNTQDPTRTQDVDLRLHYRVSRFGCTDSSSRTFRIVAPKRPNFQGRYDSVGNFYCSGENIDLLNTIPALSTGFPGSGFSGAGMGFFNNGSPAPPDRFSPVVAGVGIHPITYSFVDEYDCTSDTTKLLEVKEEARVDIFTADGGTQYCANGSPIALDYRLLSGGAEQSMQYFGDGVVGASLDPSLSYAGLAGSGYITGLYTDVFGCQAIDSLFITIRPEPVPSFVGFTNRFCANDTALLVPLSPAPTTGLGGVLSGSGVYRLADNFYFDPRRANDSLVNLTYTYTNAFECRNSATIQVRVDTIPDAHIAGIQPNYCVNETPFLLQGRPDTVLGAGTAFYGGPGVNPNTGLFSPSIAGVGIKTLIYTFTDSRGCQAVSRNDVDILPFPNAAFAGLNPEYCIDDLTDTLSALNPNGTSVFQGASVLDPLQGIVLPGLDSAGLRTVTHVFTDTSGCTNTSTQSFYIHPLPSVSLAGFDSAYCQNGSESRVIGLPVGGAITGNRINTGLNIIAAGVAGFNPSLADTGTHEFYYSYTSTTGCTNVDTVSVLLFPTYIPTVTGLAASYCETNDTVALLANPAMGRYSGPGIVTGTNSFVPTVAGAGTHTVRYAVIDSFIPTQGVPIYCENVEELQVVVNPLPVPRILSPTDNSSYCANDTSRQLFSGELATGAPAYSIFSGPNIEFDSVIVFLSANTFRLDSAFYFRPSNLVPGTYSFDYEAYNQFGCSATVTNTYFVYPVPQPSFTPLAPTYCESDAPVSLIGSPSGGVFIRNGDTLASPSFIPSGGYPAQRITSSQEDTILYLVTEQGCSNSSEQIVEIFPNPVLSFTGPSANSRYCLLPDSIALSPNIPGGVFNGSGVVFGTNIFLSERSGVGAHEVAYSYTDAGTGCSDSYVDTLRIYSQPQLSFEVAGACLDAPINFLVDNANLDISRFFQSVYFDSLTLVRWDFGDGSPAQVVTTTNPREVDAISHSYAAPGDYRVQLLIENQATCRDSFSLRLPVFPKIGNFPYLETFNDDAGNWIAEDRGQQQSSLWEWGTPANPSGIDVTSSTSSNNSPLWTTTLAQGYPLEADAWVYSPCFDITSLDRPMIALDVWSHSQPNIDGAVLEYRNAQGQWQPLGELDRGQNWYNSPIIVGMPGNQSLAPRGWSGYEENFKNARYNLDFVRHRSDSAVWKNFQIRMAFGSATISPDRPADGFAFDNVWIGNRSRNVLLEHFSSQSRPDMNRVNQHVYDLMFVSPLVRDAVLLQYQLDPDIFYNYNSANHNARSFYYGVNEAGNSVLNGIVEGTQGKPSDQLGLIDFERAMLQDPTFEITIDSFRVYNNAEAEVAVRFKARKDLPFGDYSLHLAVIEDSLSYPSGGGNPVQIHAVLRQLLPEDGTIYPRAFAIDDEEQQTRFWTFGGTGIRPANLSLVAFIQNDSTKEVYQVAASRDLLRYINALSTEELSPEVEAEANILQTMRLYPNPAEYRVTVDLERGALETMQWRLFDMQGRVLRSGTWAEGQQSLELDVQDLPGAMYIFQAQSQEIQMQRQLIIRR